MTTARARGPACRSRALEEKLKPEVLANFEEIEGLYKKLHKVQARRLETITLGEEMNIRPSAPTRSSAKRSSARSSRSGCTTTASRSW